MGKLPIIPQLTTEISVLKNIFKDYIGLAAEQINNRRVFK